MTSLKRNDPPLLRSAFTIYLYTRVLPKDREGGVSVSAFFPDSPNSRPCVQLIAENRTVLTESQT